MYGGSESSMQSLKTEQRLNIAQGNEENAFLYLETKTS